MLIVQYKNDKWASAQREFNNPRIWFWASNREKFITRKYQRLQYLKSATLKYYDDQILMTLQMNAHLLFLSLIFWTADLFNRSSKWHFSFESFNASGIATPYIRHEAHHL